MSEPLVSVVIPTYQRPHLIERSVQSALRQTFTNIEVLVVSGSIDGARAVVDGLGDWQNTRHRNRELRTSTFQKRRYPTRTRQIHCPA